MKNFNWRKKVILLLVGTLLIVFLITHYRQEFRQNSEAWEHHEDKRDIMRMMNKASDKKEYENTWFGVRLMQYPTDLLIYQQIIHETKPDYIIETGTLCGGLSLYLASIMELLELSGKLISIDISDDCWKQTKERTDLPQKILERILFIKESSISPEIHKKISKLIEGKKILIILDSLHSREHVEQELEFYAPFVPVGGYIIANDTVLGGLYLCLPWFENTLELKNIGPLYGVKSFLKNHPEFVIDHSKEKFSVSSLFSGILKRIQ